METTKVATLDSFRTKRYNKLVGVGIGLTLSLLLLVAGSAAYFSGIFVEASGDMPIELTIRDITDSSVTLAWTTAIENQGYVEYGTNPSSLTLFEPETDISTNHKVTLSLLRPLTTYYFHIKVGDKTYDDQGIPWSFVTKQSADQGQALDPSPIPEAEPTSEPESPPPASSTCPTTDCQTIQSLFGKGCTTAEYIKAGCAN